MLLRRLVPLLALSILGCAGAADSTEDGPLGEAALAQTVAQAASSSCTTTVVKGLSDQIIAVGNCVAPGAFTQVPALANVSFGSTVFPFLEQPARDAFVACANAHPGMSMGINSMLRTVAQQYLLYHWYQNGQCGIGLAATPGNSNHETGLAFDTDDHVAWQSALTAHGFKWLGSSDPVHFDYVGAGAKDYRGTDVLAFQRLWNANNPGDQIAEDGQYGPQTESRLQQSPAGGFATVPSCAPPKPDYAAKYVSEVYPMTMTAGETADAELVVENTGTKSWDGNTRLGTTVDRDRSSPFAAPGWIGPNRPAGVSGSVPPGAQLKFAFQLHAPAEPGVYLEHWNLVEEGVAWFSDQGQGGPADDAIWFQITVAPATGAGGAGGSAGTGGAGGSTLGPPPHPTGGGENGPGGGEATGTTGDTSGDGEAGGCGCEVAGGGEGTPAGVLGAVALALAAVRRRSAVRRGS